MAASLPTPGQLIIENVVLLSGSPTAFAERYGHALTPTTFAKPGNTAAANAILHFLLCIIDPDVAHTQFKPCFPILDREQERDFRRVVDARLAVLERTKLLPVGSARKSVVASAGGDRFVDLLWSLSALAVQQACLRHPAYGPVSRLRLVSQQGRADSTLSHQSSARSSRSLLSTSSRSDRHDVSKQRRFLSAGMLGAAQQRQKDADNMRTRIHTEKTTLARTADMGQSGAKTWASEADSLREKISEFEAKVRTLKDQLADMGFDENGNDVRVKARERGGSAIASGIRQSSSGEDLGDELKTSPIESMESGSSVDELLEPSDGCDDISNDLSAILNFAADTRSGRAEVDRLFSSDSTVITVKSVEKDAVCRKEAAVTERPEDIIELVRSAADELEQATKRMDEIQKARKKAEEADAVLNVNDNVSQNSESTKSAVDCPPNKLIESALLKHKELLESSRHLVKVATELTEFSRDDLKRLPHSKSDDSLQTIDPVATIPKPTWLSEVNADASQTELTNESRVATSYALRSSSDKISTTKDVRLVSQAFQAVSPRFAPRSNTFTSFSRPRNFEKPELRSSRHVRSNSASVSQRSRLDSLHGVPPSYLSAKTSRSVRFAALPPSYSANRTVGPQRAGPSLKSSYRFTEVSSMPPANSEAMRNDEIASSDVLALNDARDFGADDTSRAEKARRPEKGESSGGRDMVVSRAAPDHKGDSNEERQGIYLRGGTRSPRISRTQTPRRVVRRKEAIQRSVLGASSVTRRSAMDHISPPCKIDGKLKQERIDADKGCNETIEHDDKQMEIVSMKDTSDSGFCRSKVELTELDLGDAIPITVVEEVSLVESTENVIIEAGTGDQTSVTDETASMNNPGSGGDDVQNSESEVVDTEKKTDPRIHVELLPSSSEGSYSEEPRVVDNSFKSACFDNGKEDQLLQAYESSRGSKGAGMSDDGACLAKYINDDSSRVTSTSGGLVHQVSPEGNGNFKESGTETEKVAAPVLELGSSDTSCDAGVTGVKAHDNQMEKLNSERDGSSRGLKASNNELQKIEDELISARNRSEAFVGQQDLLQKPCTSSEPRDTVETRTNLSPHLLKGDFARKSSSLLGNKHLSEGSDTRFRKDLLRAFDPLSSKGRSPVLCSRERDNTRQVPNCESESKATERILSGARLSKPEGFFAGQTAQWQQDVQSSGDAEGMQARGLMRSASTEAGSTNLGKSSSRGASTSSARKSRVKSLRARLAAALK